MESKELTIAQKIDILAQSFKAINDTCQSTFENIETSESQSFIRVSLYTAINRVSSWLEIPDCQDIPRFVGIVRGSLLAESDRLMALQKLANKSIEEPISVVAETKYDSRTLDLDGKLQELDAFIEILRPTTRPSGDTEEFYNLMANRKPAWLFNGVFAADENDFAARKLTVFNRVLAIRGQLDQFRTSPIVKSRLEPKVVRNLEEKMAILKKAVRNFENNETPMVDGLITEECVSFAKTNVDWLVLPKQMGTSFDQYAKEVSLFLKAELKELTSSSQKKTPDMIDFLTNEKKIRLLEDALKNFYAFDSEFKSFEQPLTYAQIVEKARELVKPWIVIDSPKESDSMIFYYSRIENVLREELKRLLPSSPSTYILTDDQKIVTIRNVLKGLMDPGASIQIATRNINIIKDRIGSWFSLPGWHMVLFTYEYNLKQCLQDLCNRLETKRCSARMKIVEEAIARCRSHKIMSISHSVSFAAEIQGDIYWRKLVRYQTSKSLVTYMSEFLTDLEAERSVLQNWKFAPLI